MNNRDPGSEPALSLAQATATARRRLLGYACCAAGSLLVPALSRATGPAARATGLREDRLIGS